MTCVPKKVDTLSIESLKLKKLAERYFLSLLFYYVMCIDIRLG
jgi:hypothetical protein